MYFKVFIIKLIRAEVLNQISHVITYFAIAEMLIPRKFKMFFTFSQQTYDAVLVSGMIYEPL